MLPVLQSENEEENLSTILYLLQKVISNKEVKKREHTTSNAEDEQKLGELLEWFICHYQREKNFSTHERNNLFEKFYSEIIKQKEKLFNSKTDDDNAVRTIWCLRMLIRDLHFQQIFVDDASSLQLFIDLFNIKTWEYLQFKNEGSLLEHLSRIFQKLSIQKKNHETLLKLNVHLTMIRLLRASDVTILHCSLVFLISLAECKQLRHAISDGHVIECVVQILQEYDDASKQHAANLLRLLSSDEEIREQLFIYDSLPILLSVLNDCEQCELLWYVVWTLTRLCSEAETANEIRLLGGIQLLLNLLHKERSLTCGRNELSSGGVRRPPDNKISTKPNVGTTRSKSNRELIKNRLQLSSACCTAITELALDERCTQTIVQSNGVYVIAKLILPQTVPEKCQRAAFELQVNAIRALRFLFSLERNRKLFKLLFKPEMFQRFIDVGHFVRDSNVYKPLIELLNQMKESSIEELGCEIEELNRNKIPKRHINEFAIYDVLGAGAFGCVYRVKRRSWEKPLALKELNIAASGGKSAKERKKREIDEIVRELSIIREQLRHPNIVRYLSTFQENDKLYIEMELIEGASLQEHFTSLKEKKEQGMSEARIWKIFIQMCLALRYLHIDKRIVHRDLTANNVMLSENDKVTITDFGLAKHKRDKSEMTSAVGTILYWCPEIIKNEPYSEKADIWALGCLLYQMATLASPFNGSNMLTLAKKIVEGEFEPIADDRGYSNLVGVTVGRCLTPDCQDRPNILGVCGTIAAPMMAYTDQLATQHSKTEKKLEKERKRTQRHFHEARRNKQDYQTLFQASQESIGRTNVQKLEVNHQSSAHHHHTNPSRPNSDDTDVFINAYHEDTSASYTEGAGDSQASRNTKQLRPYSAYHRKPAHSSNPKTSDNNQSNQPTDQPGLTPRNLFNQQRCSARGRPISSSSSSRMLSISPSKVREIDDPVTKTLMQLHKVIYIDQLPPTATVNFRRRVISRYKRALFTPTNRSDMLKSEMNKLLNGSHDTIDVSFVFDIPNLGRKATAESNHEQQHNSESSITSTQSSTFNEEGVTYAQMQTMIEKVLQESGYYEVKSSSRITTQSRR